MQSKSIQSYFERNIHLFNVSTPEKNCVLLLHAINLSTGLKCDGLLESDPIAEGSLINTLDYDSKLPDFWADSEVISLRYENLSKKHVYFKYVIVNDSVEINAIAEEKNDTILSTSIR